LRWGRRIRARGHDAGAAAATTVAGQDVAIHEVKPPELPGVWNHTVACPELRERHGAGEVHLLPHSSSCGVADESGVPGAAEGLEVGHHAVASAASFRDQPQAAGVGGRTPRPSIRKSSGRAFPGIAENESDLTAMGGLEKQPARGVRCADPRGHFRMFLGFWDESGVDAQC
jgi:hypothetical protein